jgi:hypothetical protein
VNGHGPQAKVGCKREEDGHGDSLESGRRHEVSEKCARTKLREVTSFGKPRLSKTRSFACRFRRRERHRPAPVRRVVQENMRIGAVEQLHVIRSAMIDGRFETVPDAGKHAAMAAFLEHVAPGRQAEVRPGNANEYAATTVLRIALAEAVCKTRSGPPKDDAEDMAIPVWAGVLPLVQAHGAPEADARGTAPASSFVREWQT